MANYKNVNAGQFRFETDYHGFLHGKYQPHLLSKKFFFEKFYFQGFVFIFFNVACLELFNSGSMAHRTRICQSKLQSCWCFRSLIAMSKWFFTHRCFIERTTTLQSLAIARKGFKFVSNDMFMSGDFPDWQDPKGQVQIPKKSVTLPIIQIVVWWSTMIGGKIVFRYSSKTKAWVQVSNCYLKKLSERPSRSKDTLCDIIYGSESIIRWV